MDLIFVLRDDVSAIVRTSPVLKFRKDGWHFDLSTADTTPYDAVWRIKTQFAI
jgi:hypothetical protein